ncbi:class I SAM-dependent methyltransferase [Streptomyces incanus]|uniref:Class I SAM-dependent methyltransferase n=1 Tax=Streptomyces incanus TaxID=887453 RepID=A0ABW0XVK6_9ACTN
MTLLRDRGLARAFDHASHTYDRLTALNPGYRTGLPRSARRLRLPRAGAGQRILGPGCGTDAATPALLRAAPHARITAVDASWRTLGRALATPWPSHVRFQHLTAGEAATAGEGPYDTVFAACLFRDVTDPDGVLTTVRSPLRPGKRLAVHEYSLSGPAAHRALRTAVCRGVAIPAGTLGGARALHRPLWRSVLGFDPAPDVTDRRERAGLTDVRIVPVAGWRTGIVHTFLARNGSAAPREHAR